MLRKNNGTLTPQRRTKCILSPIGLAVFSNLLLFHLTKDQKGLFKSFNVVECKGLII